VRQAEKGGPYRVNRAVLIRTTVGSPAIIKTWNTPPLPRGPTRWVFRGAR
jgi:hypothetical protein